MNVFANGSMQQSQALTLALALPGMFTTWMLSQPSILGSVSWDHRPIAAISDIGLTQPGKPLQLDAHASYDPGVSNSRLSYQWSFGDGTTATGISATHTYKLPGAYTLTLAVTAPNGTRAISKSITVSSRPVQYTNPYAGYPPSNGVPPSNPLVQLPPLSSQPITPPAPTTGVPTIVLIVIGVAILLLLVAVLLVSRRSRRPAL
jgi:LPXTG-motif cell wall-anchored protein